MKSLRARRNAKKIAKHRRTSGLSKFQKKHMPTWQSFQMSELIRHLRWANWVRNDEFTSEQKKTLRKQLQQCISHLDKM